MTAKTLPVKGVPGVTQLCGPAADYSCTAGGYAGKSTGWPGERYGAGAASSNAYGYHNCTLYVAYRLAQNGFPDPGWHTNANLWAVQAASAGTSVNQTPSVGSVAQWNGGLNGHVAYVEVVTASYIEVTEDVYQDNWTGRVRIQTGTAAWPDNFIHFGSSAPAGQQVAPDNGKDLPSSLVPFTDILGQLLPGLLH
ncbi:MULTISPECIES: CHAP domain-containing protein [unclassified Pseudofrankia]|uniref:CHAP domain-containing protein n=1 Tax=unclassified Pseudofrankia TaxID=2994372 RepID=UPI001F5192FD|nr:MULTISPECIES: CHAP domain-containing protein [unclassified Pseudofrankia]MDT3438820.1 CHAP domain-containing protein [Pseudofrankia sp. BMG5.37]